MAIVAMVAAMVPMSGPTLALSPVTTGPPSSAPPLFYPALLWSAVRLPQIRSSLHKCLTPLTLLGPRVATLFQRPPSNIESHRLPITCSQIIAHVHGQRPLTCLHDPCVMITLFLHISTKSGLQPP